MTAYCPNCLSANVDWEKLGVNWYAFICLSCGEEWLADMKGDL